MQHALSRAFLTPFSIFVRWYDQISIHSRYSFYMFHQDHPAHFKVKLHSPNMVVFVPKKRGNFIAGAYEQIYDNVYFSFFHKTKTASALVTFNIGAPYSAISFSENGNTDIDKPKILFGSIVVDENLISDQTDLSKLNTDQCGEIFSTAFVFPQKSIPELYLNRSIEIQLQKYLQKYGGKVVSQKLMGDQPYNEYHTSEPDLVLWLQDTAQAQGIQAMFGIGVIRSTEKDAQGILGENVQGDDGGIPVQEQDDFDLEVSVAELKKKRGGKFQLYGEAFNVAARVFYQAIRKGHSVHKVSVFCLLLQHECTKGELSMLTIDFDEMKCIIEEDCTVRPTDTCFYLIVKRLSKNKIELVF